MRTAPLLLLAACADTPHEGLAIDAHLQATTCDDAPCTHVDIVVLRDDVPIADALVRLSIDGEPPFDVPHTDVGHVLEVPGWARRARVDVVAGDEAAFVEGDNRLSSPYEMSVSLLPTVTVGSVPHLTWQPQGGAVEVEVLFATKVPTTRFGFVETFGRDDGDVALEDIFLAEGEYTIALYRSLHADGILWGSNWQQRVFAVTNPQ